MITDQVTDHVLIFHNRASRKGNQNQGASHPNVAQYIQLVQEIFHVVNFVLFCFHMKIFFKTNR